MLCGIVNMGNIVGLVACLMVIFTIILYNKFKNNKTVIRLLKAVGVVLSLSATYAVFISLFMFMGTLRTPENALQTGTEGASAPKTVIVLGCQAKNGQPSQMLKARLNAAAEYLKENPAAVCIVTGGQGHDEIEPEAETMARYMITECNIENRIYKENKAKNTSENLLYSAEIISAEGLPKDVVIVSESYHVYRGMRNAEKQGLTACALPAPSDTPWALPSYWVREIMAISRDFAVDIIG